MSTTSASDVPLVALIDDRIQLELPGLYGIQKKCCPLFLSIPLQIYQRFSGGHGPFQECVDRHNLFIR